MENTTMDKIIATMEEAIKQVEWDIQYHTDKANKATEKRNSLLEGLSIIKAQQEEELPV